MCGCPSSHHSACSNHAYVMLTEPPFAAMRSHHDKYGSHWGEGGVWTGAVSDFGRDSISPRVLEALRRVQPARHACLPRRTVIVHGVADDRFEARDIGREGALSAR